MEYAHPLLNQLFPGHTTTYALDIIQLNFGYTNMQGYRRAHDLSAVAQVLLLLFTVISS